MPEQLIILDKLYQFLRIGRVSGIAGLLQSIGPRLVICNLIIEEESVTFPVTEKIRMVTI